MKIIAQQMSEAVSHPISDGATEQLASILVRTEVSKSKLLLREGEISNLMYYVESGLLRQFCYKNGKEMTEHFALEGSIFTSIDSFFCRMPTCTMIEAVEPATLYGIPYIPLMTLINDCREISSLYRCIIEKMLVNIQKRIFAFRFETAGERYARLLRERPDIVRRVPLIYIASYLLMSPETLSRVRAGILGGLT